MMIKSKMKTCNDMMMGGFEGVVVRVALDKKNLKLSQINHFHSGAYWWYIFTVFIYWYFHVLQISTSVARDN